jgi:HSP90 family molecular chaperone
MTIKTDEDGERYYTPDGENIDPIQIPDSEFADENAEFKEGESFEAEVDTVMARQFLSDNIYAGFEASIRELYNNEITASHKAIAMGDNAHPIIHVTIDPMARYFEITGEDSLGIAPMVFRRKVSVMGRSGNLEDGGEIGQFGLGFASYKKMFNIVHVSTWARGRKEDGTEFKPYTILCEGGIKFTPTKAEKMLHLGTKIHGIYKEGISADKIIAKVKECAKHQNVPTWIHLVNDSGEENKGNYKCEQYRDGYHYLMQMRANAFESHSNRDESTVFFRPIKIIRDDFEFYAYLGMNRSRWGGVDVDSIADDDCEIR